MRLAPILAALAITLGLAGPARAQNIGETIDVGGWKVRVDKNKDGSQTCVAVWTFDDKSMIGFGADTNNMTFLIVSEPEANLTKDQQIQVKYTVDKKPQRNATGIVTSKSMVVIPIENPDKEFADFQAGSTLAVEFGGDSYDESLGGSKDAIHALAQCITTANGRK